MLAYQLLHFLNFQTGDIKCDDCDFLFNNPKNLQRHRRLEHAEGDIYSCFDCMNNFVTKEELMEHMHQHNKQDKPFKCNKCERRFTRKYHLERHISQKGCNGGEKLIFTCQVHLFILIFIFNFCYKILNGYVFF